MHFSVGRGGSYVRRRLRLAETRTQYAEKQTANQAAFGHDLVQVVFVCLGPSWVAALTRTLVTSATTLFGVLYFLWFFFRDLCVIALFFLVWVVFVLEAVVIMVIGFVVTHLEWLVGNCRFSVFVLCFLRFRHDVGSWPISFRLAACFDSLLNCILFRFRSTEHTGIAGRIEKRRDN